MATAKTNITNTHVPTVGRTETLLVSSHDRGAADWAAQEAEDDHEPETPAGPAPVFISITPSFLPNTDPATTLTIDGLNFVTGAKVRIDGVDQATTFVSATQLTISYDPAPPARVVQFSVRNPDGGTSASIAFNVT